ncbi:MAG: hypothetical protein ACYCR3_00695 [Acidithiobacillus sp.]
MLQLYLKKRLLTSYGIHNHQTPDLGAKHSGPYGAAIQAASNRDKIRSKGVKNDGLDIFTGDGVVLMDIIGTVSGIFFQVTAECEQAGRWSLKNIQCGDSFQRRKLGLDGGL